MNSPSKRVTPHIISIEWMLSASVLLPFVAANGLLWQVASGPRYEAVTELLPSYTAIVVSFAAAVQWGVAMNASPTAWRRMLCSMLGVALAIASLTLPTRAALLVLGATMLLTLRFDWYVYKQQRIPHWYWRSRVIITTIAGANLFVSIALLSGYTL